jgi:uracil-DNA glycosylase family 4
LTDTCLCPEANRFGARHVGGYGPLKPRIMFLGEAPGADEAQYGIPFSGGTGRILSAWCASSGIDRIACHLDNVAQHRPPGNDIDKIDLALQVPSVLRRIREVDPSLVVLLGNTALQVFVDGGISDWRGSYFPIDACGKTYAAVATYHPAFIMRQRKMWDVVIHDLKRAKELSNKSGYKEESYTYYTNPTPVEASEFVDYCLQAEIVSVDIETDFQWTSVDMCGVCPEPGLAMCIPMEADFMRLWFKFFKGVKSQVMHNGPAFDAWHLRRLGLPCRSPEHDTMLYSHLIRNDLPHDLGFQCSIYTLYPYYKDQIKLRTEWYNCRDVDTTMQVLLKQLPELKERGLL